MNVNILNHSYIPCIMPIHHGEWSFACIKFSFWEFFEYFCINICYGLYMLNSVSGTIRMCNTVGVDVTLCVLSDPQPSCFEISVLLAAFRWRCRTLRFSCTIPSWRPPCSHLDILGLNLWICKPSLLKWKGKLQRSFKYLLVQLGMKFVQMSRSVFHSHIYYLSSGEPPVCEG